MKQLKKKKKKKKTTTKFRPKKQYGIKCSKFEDIYSSLLGYISPLVRALLELYFPRYQNGLNDPKDNKNGTTVNVLKF